MIFLTVCAVVWKQFPPLVVFSKLIINMVTQIDLEVQVFYLLQLLFPLQRVSEGVCEESGGSCKVPALGRPLRVCFQHDESLTYKWNGLLKTSSQGERCS